VQFKLLFGTRNWNIQKVIGQFESFLDLFLEHWTHKCRHTSCINLWYKYLDVLWHITYVAQRTALPTERTVASNVILQTYSRLQHNPNFIHHRRQTMELKVTYTPANVAYPCHLYLIEVYYASLRGRQIQDRNWCGTCSSFPVLCVADETVVWLWEYTTHIYWREYRNREWQLRFIVIIKCFRYYKTIIRYQ
jgi:hypothetical protein